MSQKIKTDLVVDGKVGVGTDAPVDLLNVNKENAESKIVISRGGTNLAVSTSIGRLDFYADYNGSPIPYANINAYSNALSGVRSSLDFNVKSTSGDILTGLTVYGTSSGVNVGIGTTTPNAGLHVYSSGNGELEVERAGGALISLQAQATLGAIGTDSNHPLYLKTNAGTRLAITTSGNVGIGTTSPQKPIDVISNANDFVTVGARTLSVGQWAGIHFGYRESNTNYRKSAIVFERTDLTSSDAQGKIHILNGPQNSNSSASLSDSKLTIAENGFVGIGTTSPNAKLQVESGTSNGNGSGIRINRTGSFYHSLEFTTNNVVDWSVGQNSNNSFEIYENGLAASTRFTIKEGGNIGIGTTAPGFKLDVNGTVKAATYLVTPLIYSGGGNVVFGNVAQFNDWVGIGTTTPSEKLEVAGNAILDASNANLKIKSGTTGTKGDIQWTFNTDSTVYASVGITYDNRATDGFLIDSGYPITLDYASNYIRFSNNGSEKMRLDASGNLGIGTTTPSQKLHVAGKIYSVSGAVDGGEIRLANSGGGSNWYWAARTTGLNLGELGAADGRIFIANGGNVGIGTTSPGGRLDIVGPSGGDVILRLQRQSVGSYDYFVSDAGAGAQQLFLRANPVDSGFIFQTKNSGGTSINALTVAPSGDVGIGTTSPGTKLHVSGGDIYTDSQFRLNQGQGITWNNGDNYIKGISGYHLQFTTYDGASAQREVLRLTGGSAASGGGRVGIGTTSPQAPLHVIAANSNNNDLIQEWSYTNGTQDTYSLMLKQTVTAGVVRYNFSMVNAGTGYNDVLVLDRGSVGIGTTDPAYKLDVAAGTIKATNNLLIGEDAYSLSGDYVGMKTTFQSGTTDYMILSGKSDGATYVSAKDGEGVYVRGGGNNTGNQIHVPDSSYIQVTTNSFNVSGDVLAYATSDARLKDNVTPIQNPIQKVKAIGGYEFDWNDKQDTYEGHDVGVLAQEIEAIMPEVVTTRENGYKAVKYEKIVPLLIEAIKEQNKAIEDLKQRIAKLEA